ncbi:MAG: phospholipase [Comamonadaceae bacterium]|nr:MAG: phospholipase [Comamonadaceae bacterium]
MFLRTSLAAVAAALILVACGGGGDGPSTPPGPRTTAVKVVGDSLSDSGTFGIKFTVQGTTAPSLIWTDRVAAAVAAPALCPRYSAPGGIPALNPAATACTSYGVGSGRINPRGEPDTTRFSVVQQLKDVRAQSPYNPEELLLVDGGGNDIADLVGDYLAAPGDAGAAFLGLAGELLMPGEMAGLTLEQIGGVYMSKLADRLANALAAEALDRGAQRVVVITAPDVTRTPRFTAVLAGVEATVNAGGGNGAAAAAGIKALANQWTVAFNTQLKARFAGHSRVAVVDFYAELNKWLDTPATYGLTNTTTPACPVVGVDGQGLPAYNIATCTDTLLSATPPTGDWWKTYVFSDNFHGTPRTNELMGQLVVQALEAKGWK